MGVEATITGGGNSALVDDDGNLGVNTSIGSVVCADAVFDFLTLISGPSGADSDDMITDYAGSVPSVFGYTVPAGQTLYLSRVNFLITDGGVKPDTFGGLSALTNGCTVKIHDAAGTARLDFMAGQTIKANSQFAYLAGADIQPVAGTAIDSLPIRWTIGKAFSGRSLRLPQGWSIRWTNNDALTGLNEFRAMLQGWMVQTGG